MPAERNLKNGAILNPALDARLKALLDFHTWKSLSELSGVSASTLQRAGKGMELSPPMIRAIELGVDAAERANAERAEQGLPPVQVPRARCDKLRTTPAQSASCSHARWSKDFFGYVPGRGYRRGGVPAPAKQVLRAVGIPSPMDVGVPSAFVAPPVPKPVRRAPQAPRRGRKVRARKAQPRKISPRIVFVLAVALGLIVGAGPWWLLH